MPPDFGSANIVLGIIGAGAALVVFFYSLQTWVLPLIHTLFNSDKSADERMGALLKKYQEETFELGKQARSISEASPRLKMLRTALHGDEMTCLMVNQGGKATDLKIETAASLHATLTPDTVLDNGQTGSVALRNVQSNRHQLQFQISYTDSLGMLVTRTYRYSDREKKFIEV